MKAKFIGIPIGKLISNTLHEVSISDNKVYVEGNNYKYMIKYSNMQQLEKDWKIIKM